ncbi:hypothetical protein SNK03_011601 [Fusarium graminearum]
MTSLKPEVTTFQSLLEWNLAPLSLERRTAARPNMHLHLQTQRLDAETETTESTVLEKRPYLKFYDLKEAALREKIWCPLHDCLDQVDAGSVECLAQANLVLIANQGHLQQ